VTVSAREKAQAVLSVWAGRRKPAKVCKALGIPWALLNGWEQRALAGMLKALGAGEAPAPATGPMLNPRLERLLASPVPTPAVPAAEPAETTTA
jgi:hypothetical protein